MKEKTPSVLNPPKSQEFGDNNRLSPRDKKDWRQKVLGKQPREGSNQSSYRAVLPMSHKNGEDGVEIL